MYLTSRIPDKKQFVKRKKGGAIYKGAR